MILWGWLWYGIKVLLLRRFVGLTKGRRARRLHLAHEVPFDLAGLLQRYSERRIRIADMIGRRGRFMMMGMLGYWYIYSSVSRDPKPSFLVSGLQENLFDAIALNWMMLAIYYSNGFLGRVAYGAQSRIMDGTLARANCLVITTLWSLFKFFMVPLGFQIASALSSPDLRYGVLLYLVSYLRRTRSARLSARSSASRSCASGASAK